MRELVCCLPLSWLSLVCLVQAATINHQSDWKEIPRFSDGFSKEQEEQTAGETNSLSYEAHKETQKTNFLHGHASTSLDDELAELKADGQEGGAHRPRDGRQSNLEAVNNQAKGLAGENTLIKTESDVTKGQKRINFKAFGSTTAFKNPEATGIQSDGNAIPARPSADLDNSQNEVEELAEESNRYEESEEGRRKVFGIVSRNRKISNHRQSSQTDIYQDREVVNYNDLEDGRIKGEDYTRQSNFTRVENSRQVKSNIRRQMNNNSTRPKNNNTKQHIINSMMQENSITTKENSGGRANSNTKKAISTSYKQENTRQETGTTRKEKNNSKEQVTRTRLERHNSTEHANSINSKDREGRQFMEGFSGVSEYTDAIFGHLASGIAEIVNAYVDLLPNIAGCMGKLLGCHICVFLTGLDAGPRLVINLCLEKCTPGLFGACISLGAQSLNLVLTNLLNDLAHVE